MGGRHGSSLALVASAFSGASKGHREGRKVRGSTTPCSPPRPLSPPAPTKIMYIFIWLNIIILKYNLIYIIALVI